MFKQVEEQYYLSDLLDAIKEVESQYNLMGAQHKGQFFLDINSDAPAEVSFLATRVLFNKQGRVEFELKAELQRQGYTVIMFESVKMGWTICGLNIPGKGIVTFYNDVLLDKIERGEIPQDVL